MFLLLQQSLRFFLTHLWSLCLIIVVIELPAIGIDVILNEILWLDDIDSNVEESVTQLSSWDTAVELLIIALYALAYTASTATLIVFIGSALQGQALPISRCLLQGIPAWVHLFLAMVVANLLLVIGFLALIVPGIYLLYRLAFVEICVVREGARVFDSIERSFELSRGMARQILPPIVLLNLLIILGYYGTDVLLESTDLVNNATYILTELIFSLALSFLIVVAYHLYEMALKVHTTT